MSDRAMSAGGEAGRGTVLRAAVLCLAALFACYSVFLLNGRPLFYFDTAGYVDQGTTALEQLGLIDGAPRAAVDPSAPADPPKEGKGTVDGSRSATYALVAGILAHLRLLEGLTVLNALSVFLALGLTMRAARRSAPALPLSEAVAVPVIAASFGALPFFVAYLMPDTFAGALILSVAGLTAFGRDMRFWEIVGLFAVAAVAVVSHLSHLAIAAALVPFVAAISLVMSRRRWWLPPLVLCLVVAAGAAQQMAFRVVAEKVSHSEVVIKPYIIARLVQDGPGYDYLARHCPDAAIPTCPLYAALQRSDDPYRLTASHIIFETSERLGSFRLMTAEDQRRVASDQTGFFLAVLKDAPVATLFALAKNTFIQSGMISVDMTLPTPNMIARHDGVEGLATGAFADGRITRDTSWLAWLTPAQGVLYALSLAAALWLTLRPGTLPPALRAFAVAVLLGILANAFVCGAISQPATRYGARVIWLLPMLAAIMILFHRSAASGAPNQGPR